MLLVDIYWIQVKLAATMVRKLAQKHWLKIVERKEFVQLFAGLLTVGYTRVQFVCSSKEC